MCSKFNKTSTVANLNELLENILHQTDSVHLSCTLIGATACIIH